MFVFLGGELMQTEAVRELVDAAEESLRGFDARAYQRLRRAVEAVKAEEKHECEPADINGKLLCFMCRQPADAPIH